MESRVPSEVKRGSSEVNPELLLMARNFLQLYLAQQEQHVAAQRDNPNKDINEALAIEAAKNSDAFKAWIEGKGSEAFVEYARSHSEGQIIAFEDMGDIIEQFKKDRSRIFH